jgi:hypothetical protein
MVNLVGLESSKLQEHEKNMLPKKVNFMKTRISSFWKQGSSY